MSDTRPSVFRTGIQYFHRLVVKCVVDDYLYGDQVGVYRTCGPDQILTENESRDSVLFKDSFADVCGDGVVEFLNYFHNLFLIAVVSGCTVGSAEIVWIVA